MTTILRFVRGLELLGHKCVVWVNVLDLHNQSEFVDYKETVENDYFHVDAEVKRLPENLDGIVGDALIATDRYTCYPVRAMKGFSRRFYFVQDQEELFYSVGSEYFLTLATYKFGFDCLCAGKWLESNMRNRFGNWSMSWDLSVDRSIYCPGERKETHIPRIACYSRFVTPRRCVDLMMLALDILAVRGNKFAVDFFGWNLPSIEVKYPYVDHGIISEQSLAEIYRNASVGVVFSGTNYSLIPKEMMSCGLPVVELNTESINMEFDDNCLIKSEPDPEQIACNIENILNSPDLRQHLRLEGLKFVESDSWTTSVEKVNSALIERIKSNG